jgi:hypothetical protein
MPKISECVRCRFYEGNPYIVCANFPSGPDADFCPHFARLPDAEPEELWEPQGASYYNGELILQPKQRWTREEQLWLLDHHPMFTGRYPSV